MIPIVNHDHKYVMFYSAKVASSALRELFVELHLERNAPAVDRYHNLAAEFAPQPQREYADYFLFLVTRNPYSRILSAYLDQYVYAGSGLQSGDVGSGGQLNFINFLQSLKEVPDAERDVHFQTQACRSSFAHIPSLAGKKLDYCGDISGLNEHVQKVYRQIFNGTASGDQRQLSRVTDFFQNRIKRNSLLYGDEPEPHAAELSPGLLRERVVAPQPQDFYTNVEVRALVHSIYRQDFDDFGYDITELPKWKSGDSVADLPTDFDWRLYLELNPDLQFSGMQSEREVVRHFLEFGRYEEIPRAYQLTPPENFDWRRYLLKNPDLEVAGIDQERAAVVHYLGFGIREGRKY